MREKTEEDNEQDFLILLVNTFEVKHFLVQDFIKSYSVFAYSHLKQNSALLNLVQKTIQ